MSLDCDGGTKLLRIYLEWEEPDYVKYGTFYFYSKPSLKNIFDRTKCVRARARSGVLGISCVSVCISEE